MLHEKPSAPTLVVRPKIALLMGAIALLIEGGLVVTNLLGANVYLALFGVFSFILTAWYVAALNNDERTRRFRAIIMLCGIQASIAYGIITFSPNGALFDFPLVFVAFLIVERVKARIFSGLVVITTPILCSYFWEVDLLIRLGLALLVVAVFVDLLVGRILELSVELKDASLRDPLTGCYNRRFLPDLESRIAHGGQESFLIVIDVDRFKTLNDSQGHAAGDLVLCKIVTIANEAIRAEDSIIRLGGDEFLVSLFNYVGANALVIAERIRRQVAADTSPLMKDITLSMGLVFANPQSGIEDILLEADRLMYSAKSKGRNSLVYSQQSQIFRVH